MIGKTIAQYRILEKLGEGGMGVVYKAEDTKLGREVALKFLPSRLSAHGEERDRFLLEAQTASRLNHPNICTIYQIDEADGETFIAMELVEGTTLREWVRRKIQENDGYRKVALREATELALQIADGLQAAHDKQIVHRDVKAENIMVTPDGRAKVMDFGLAKLQGVSKLTQVGSTIGTLAYMSPEQVEGIETDHRTDIFSFGVLLFEMLTGKLPFQAVHEAALMYEIINVAPPAPSTLRAGLEAELDRIVLKCLEKDRETRYQSMREIVADLRRLHRDSEGTRLDRTAVRPVAPAASSSSVPADRTPARDPRRMLLLFGVISLVAALAGAGAWYLWRPSSTTIRSVAVLPFASPPSDSTSEYLGDGVTEGLINSLSKLPGVKLMSASSVFRYKGKDADPQKVGKELGVGAVLTGRLARRGDEIAVSAELINTEDNTHLWGNQYQRKVADLLALQGEISREISEQLKVTLTGEQAKAFAAQPTENSDAYQNYLKGRFYWNKRTEAATDVAIEYYKKAIELDPGFARAHLGLANAIMTSTKASQEPDLCMPQMFTAATRAVELDPGLAEAYATLGAYKGYYLYDFAAADEYFKKAITLDPTYPTGYHWYAEHLVWEGKFDEGLALYEKAIALDPLSQPILSDYGAGFYFARRYDRSIEVIRKAIAMDPTFVRSYFYLSWPFSAKGMNDSAAATIFRGMEVRGDDPATIALARAAYAKDGMKGLARLDQEGKISIYDEQSSFPQAQNAMTLGEYDKAIEHLEEAYRKRSYTIVTIGVTPMFDPLRGKPRFNALMKKFDFVTNTITKQ